MQVPKLQGTFNIFPTRIEPTISSLVTPLTEDQTLLL
jgi:hypothetical protein